MEVALDALGQVLGQVQTVLVHVLLEGMVLVLLEVEAIAVVVRILIDDCLWQYSVNSNVIVWKWES